MIEDVLVPHDLTPFGDRALEALANLGKMQVRTFDDPEMKNRTPPTREAQVMIRHPNYTGMQMDQLTREYTPAKFVQEMENVIFSGFEAAVARINLESEPPAEMLNKLRESDADIFELRLAAIPKASA